MTTLRTWLAGLGLNQYYEVLESSSVDFDVLSELTEDDLRELGFTLGDRKRMMLGLTALTRHGAPPGREGAAPGSVRLSGEVQAAGLPDFSSDELRQLTLMFVDLVGSTRLSTEMSLEVYRETLQAYQNICLDAIRKYFGYVAQFQGDGVIAYFGYPIVEENDAERAVLAGLEISGGVRLLALPTGHRLGVRIGIATGDVLIGEIVGGGKAGTHFALGDIPNLAARIEAATETDSVAISSSTYRLLGNNFDCRFAGAHRFKGFSEPIGVWVIRGVRQSERRFEARQHGTLSPLIGREEECKILESRWANVRRGMGQAVLISGEAGIGKSRLAEALIEQTRDQPATMLSFQCSPITKAVRSIR